MKKIIFVFFSLTFSGCLIYDPPSGTIEVYNDSDSSIYVSTNCTEVMPKFPELRLFLKSPAKMVDENGKRINEIFIPDYKVYPHKMSKIAGFGSFKNPKIDCQKIYIFFIKESTLKERSWNEIYINQLYEKKLKFTNQELDSLQWKIRYSTN